jgi:hypothetical protein
MPRHAITAIHDVCGKPVRSPGPPIVVGSNVIRHPILDNEVPRICAGCGAPVESFFILPDDGGISILLVFY